MPDTTQSEPPHPPDPPDTRVVAEVLAEAERLRVERSDDWAAWDWAVRAEIAANDEIVAGWAKRSAPPRPDVSGLGLPLPYLGRNLLRCAEEIAGANAAEAAKMLPLWAAATARCPDPRRLDVFLSAAVRAGPAGEDAFDPALPDAVPAERLTAFVAGRLAADPPLRCHRGLHRLLDLRAAELPAGTRTAAFDHIRRKWPDGPSNGDGERFWATLFRLDPERAGREVTAHYRRHDLYVLQLLCEFGVPCPPAAAAIRGWLRRPLPHWADGDAMLRVALLRADPEGSRADFLRRFDEVLAAARAEAAVSRITGRDAVGREAALMFRALLDLTPDDRLPELRRYASEPGLGEWDRRQLAERSARPEGSEGPARPEGSERAGPTGERERAE